ncbi:MAG TPA: aminotransferase class III-fold pyridoxal phosphate-dependent enzyme, partial [Thermoanaerobaculia bacterium]|nr:aminotransferase class III-fold pyridoxal phosphate-dependent enzyme [Thermoanaerobaculia bacterium]
AELVPVDEARIHFAVSGADAVEVAAKTAVLATGRPDLVAFEPAYHGLTLGALALTARDEFRRPFARHLHPRVHRLPYGCGLPELEATVRRHAAAAVVLEPVVGREGVVPPPAGWLAGVAEVCRRLGALLVVDEVFTGFGRTGRLFAVDEEGVRPDLLCCGKALGGGLPIGAVAGRAPLMEAWRTGGEALHTGTFLGHPLAAAAALAVLDLMAEEDLPGRARRLGEEVAGRLAPWPERFAAVAAVRGRGLVHGVELASAAAARRVAGGLLARGFLALAGGPEGRVLQLLPPLAVTEAQLRAALGALEEALT